MKDISIKTYKSITETVSTECSPMDLYKQLYQHDSYAFLYESLESRSKRGRYSFIGGKPMLAFKCWGNEVEIEFKNDIFKGQMDPVGMLKRIIKDYHSFPQIKPFSGGAVGYMAYDAVRFFEKIPDKKPDEYHFPDMFFILPQEIIVFDHLENRVDLIVYSETGGQKSITSLKKKIGSCVKKDSHLTVSSTSTPFVYESNFSKESFQRAVEKAKEYILAGDIFQVVLSQKLTFQSDTDPLQIYSALRIANPSHYMYYLHLDDLNVVGSSPEILVKLLNGRVTIRPLAGTRPRGNTIEEDEKLEEELLQDEKERAEHIMLVDLARNDIGQVCEYGSVHTTNLLEVEKFSKVMHIVSNVTGKLMKDRDAFDLLAASFPAGTVSGAPKIRAMEIIDELEPTRRGIYAGSIGYFGFSGDMDMCIAIRMIVIKKGRGFIQVGAGIVADSIAEREYQETLNKAKALIHAVEIAGGYDDCADR